MNVAGTVSGTTIVRVRAQPSELAPLILIKMKETKSDAVFGTYFNPPT